MIVIRIGRSANTRCYGAVNVCLFPILFGNMLNWKHFHIKHIIYARNYRHSETKDNHTFLINRLICSSALHLKLAKQWEMMVWMSWYRLAATVIIAVVSATTLT